MAVKKKNLIEKRNILNELRCNSMHLQELRFFTIYLSKINARNPEETRCVKFLLTDFLAIMDLGKVNIADLRQTTNSLLCKVVNIPTETGGYRGFQLFKECVVDKDDGGWYIAIDAHDKALPLMFDFKRDYFTYELWNALKLNSVNQLRMYEVLKQYEKIGERTISLEELKALLFIDVKEYSRFNDLKTWVLDACQKALNQNTDISYEYELIKKGRGGKVSQIRFIIKKNADYIDQLNLDDFIQQQDIENAEDEACVTIEESTCENEQLEFMAEACNNEFTATEIQVLYNLIISIMPYTTDKNMQIEWYNYLKRKYDEMLWRSERTQIANRFGYLKKIVESDLLIS